MPEQSNDYRVVTFGSGGVGKSSLGKKNKSFNESILCVCLYAYLIAKYIDRPHWRSAARVKKKTFFSSFLHSFDFGFFCT